MQYASGINACLASNLRAATRRTSAPQASTAAMNSNWPTFDSHIEEQQSQCDGVLWQTHLRERTREPQAVQKPEREGESATACARPAPRFRVADG